MYLTDPSHVRVCVRDDFQLLDELNNITTILVGAPKVVVWHVFNRAVHVIINASFHAHEMRKDVIHASP